MEEDDRVTTMVGVSQESEEPLCLLLLSTETRQTAERQVTSASACVCADMRKLRRPTIRQSEREIKRAGRQRERVKRGRDVRVCVWVC